MARVWQSSVSLRALRRPQKNGINANNSAVGMPQIASAYIDSPFRYHYLSVSWWLTKKEKSRDQTIGGFFHLRIAPRSALRTCASKLEKKKCFLTYLKAKPLGDPRETNVIVRCYENLTIRRYGPKIQWHQNWESNPRPLVLMI